MADKEFISIKKAVNLTGKSEQKVIKLWETHRKTKQVREKNGRRYIALSLLKKKYGFVPRQQPDISDSPIYTPIHEQNTTTVYEQSAPTDLPESEAQQTNIKNNFTETEAILEIFKSQLIEKDKQLSAKDTQITQLIERTREQNNIIYSLEQHQQQLESKIGLQLSQRAFEEVAKPEKLQINYPFIALIMLLVGVVLIIFYTLLSA